MVLKNSEKWCLNILEHFKNVIQNLLPKASEHYL